MVWAPEAIHDALASGITFRATGHHPYEGPLVFRPHGAADGSCSPTTTATTSTRYVPFVTTDIASGDWTRVDDSVAHIPASTKHGCVLPLTRSEWLRLRDHGW